MRTRRAQETTETMSNLALIDEIPTAPPGGRPAGPLVEVVVPVHNEQRVLAASVTRLHRYLTASFPFPFRITIADNASTDRTWPLARELSARLPQVAAVHLDQKGRGRALRQVWGGSDAEVLAYTDVDLSTDLAALLPLVAPLVSGHSDLAIGTRLHRGARIVRGPKREAISRAYNLLLRATLGTGFSDAQCGFKAIRADAAGALLPLVRDADWFFDTELLVLAERAGLRIHEVPVDWVEDPDSRVAIVPTALEDLRGVARLAAGLLTGSLRTRLVAAVPASPRHPGLPGQVLRFAGVGIASTLAYLALFVVLPAVLHRPGRPPTATRAVDLERSATS
jgi:glycosyltransferase involved in cell wall biosynthesis